EPLVRGLVAVRPRLALEGDANPPLPLRAHALSSCWLVRSGRRTRHEKGPSPAGRALPGVRPVPASDGMWRLRRCPRHRPARRSGTEGVRASPPAAAGGRPRTGRRAIGGTLGWAWYGCCRPVRTPPIDPGGVMIKPMPWIGRSFVFGLDPAAFPMVLERLRGTPARAAALVDGLPETLLASGWEGSWSVKEHIGHLADLDELDQARLDDFLARRPVLSAWDVANPKTEE